jgi:deoxyribose-phosphate aldolase
MVLPVGLLLSPSPPYAEIYHHVRTVIQGSGPVPVKVIIETGLLKFQEKKIAACLLAAEAGAAFVKTCTGFSGGQATEEDVRLMWHAVRSYNAKEEGKVKVKASGGVRTLQSCLAMLKAGAERIGTCVSIFNVPGL